MAPLPLRGSWCSERDECGYSRLAGKGCTYEMDQNESYGTQAT